MNIARRAALGPTVVANAAGLRLLEHRAIPRALRCRKTAPSTSNPAVSTTPGATR